MHGTSRLTVVWLGLVVATVVAVVLGELLDTSEAVATVLVLAVAVAKVHVVTTWFMGARHGPRWVALAIDAWVLAVLIGLSTIYLVQR